MSRLDLKNIGGAPSSRIRRADDRSVLPDRDFVLYWMIAARRTRYNFALDRACAWVRALSRPLLVFEALRVGYPRASDRLHRFVLDGMADNERSLTKAGIAYYPYVEPTRGAGEGTSVGACLPSMCRSGGRRQQRAPSPCRDRSRFLRRGALSTVRAKAMQRTTTNRLSTARAGSRRTFISDMSPRTRSSPVSPTRRNGPQFKWASARCRPNARG